MTKLLVTGDEETPGLIFESSFTDEGDEVVSAVLMTARIPVVIQ